MAKRTYEFDILAKIDQAIASVDSFSDQTQKRLDKIGFNTTVSAIKDGFEIVKAAGEAAFHFIESVGEKALEQALEAEKAQVALANSLRLTGDYSEQAIEQYDSLADSLSSVSTFSREAVKESAALAKQYSLTNSEAIKVVKVAADLAAIQGTSLDEATRRVAQTFNGFVDKSLTKVLPALKTLSIEQLKTGAGFDLIAQKVKGSAEALGDTFGGAATRVSLAFGEVLETIGKLVTENPKILAGFKELQKGLVDFNAELEANGDSLRSLVTDGFLFVVQSAPLMIKALELVDNTISTLTASTKSFFLLTTRLPGALVQAATGSSEALDDLKSKLVGIDDAVKSAQRSKTLYEPLTQQAQALADRITKATESAKALNKEISQGASTTGLQERLKIDTETFAKYTLQVRDARNQIDDILKKKFSEIGSGPFQALVNFTIKGQEELDKTKTEIDKAIREIVTSKEIPEALKKQAIGFAQDARREFTTNTIPAIAAGLVNSMLKGAAGAKDAIASIFGAIADAYIPGIGGIVKEIISVLEEGPDKVEQMVTEFYQAIPKLLTNIVASIPRLILVAFREFSKGFAELVKTLIPTLVDELVKDAPQFVEVLIEAVPEMAYALIVGIVQGIPKIIAGFAKGIVSAAKAFVDEIVKLVKGAGGLLGESGSGGKGGSGIIGGIASAGSWIGDFLGFADGGKIPDKPQYRNDQMIARLSGGERVLDRDTNQKFEELVDQMTHGGSGAAGPTQHGTINLQIGLETFAKISVEADRRGMRLRYGT